MPRSIKKDVLTRSSCLTKVTMSNDQLSSLIEDDTTSDEVEVHPSSPSDLDLGLIECKDLFKPRYRPRCLKNKGAILILVWNYAVCSIFGVIITTIVNNQVFVMRTISILCGGVVGSTIAWLVITRFGRYRVITWSAWTMWISSVLMTSSSVIAELVEPYKSIDLKVSLVFLL